jgi:hypothetical protein
MDNEPIPIRKIAAYVPVTRELLQDVPDVSAYITHQLWLAMDRKLRPWAYPDRPIVIPFEPFPRLTKWWRHLTGRHWL